MEKLKILILSDHAMSPSGVGVQTKLNRRFVKKK